MGIEREAISYRQSTAAIVTDTEGRILVVQKKNYADNEWDIPGGGIEGDEAAEKAILRELEEELGTKKFEIVQRSEVADCYEWPDDVIDRKLKEKGHTWRGQQRVQFLVRFTGKPEEIVFPPEEIKQVKWVSVDELEQYLVFPDQYQKAKRLLEEFGLICSMI